MLTEYHSKGPLDTYLLNIGLLLNTIEMIIGCLLNVIVREHWVLTTVTIYHFCGGFFNVYARLLSAFKFYLSQGKPLPCNFILLTDSPVAIIFNSNFCKDLISLTVTKYTQTVSAKM